MPILKNERHEIFAQEVAKGTGRAEAYVIAGYNVSHSVALSAGGRLSKNVLICSRIVEIQQQGADRAVVSVESLIRDAEAARELAMRIKQPSAAVAAIREKGVLSGKRVERSEQEQPGEFADLDGMNVDQLREYLARESASLAPRLESAGRGRGKGKASGELH